MWPFKKQSVDTVIIHDVVWAKNTSEGVAKDLEVKETKRLLNNIGRWIESHAKDGEASLTISAFYLENNYKTPCWILRDDVANALTQYGYEVDKSINRSYYIKIKWGEEQHFPDFRPITTPAPGKKVTGE